jgi:cytochrome b561
MIPNTPTSWGTPAKLLHWAVAALVLVQIALGWAATTWRLSPTKLDLFIWHKSIGMVILALMVTRVAWRFVRITPSLPADMQLLERRAARASHFLLYLLMLFMPVTGWIINSAANIPFRIFRLVPFPTIVEPDKAMADTAAHVHFVLFVVLSMLLLVHVGAALRHHFIKRNDVLLRMLPGTANAK